MKEIWLEDSFILFSRKFNRYDDPLLNSYGSDIQITFAILKEDLAVSLFPFRGVAIESVWQKYPTVSKFTESKTSDKI